MAKLSSAAMETIRAMYSNRPDFSAINPDSPDYDRFLKIANDYDRNKFSHTDRKNHVCEYVDSIGLDSKYIRAIDRTKFNSIGIHAFILSNGGSLNERHMLSFKAKLDSLMERARENWVEPIEKRDPTFFDTLAVNPINVLWNSLNDIFFEKRNKNDVYRLIETANLYDSEYKTIIDRSIQTIEDEHYSIQDRLETDEKSFARSKMVIEFWAMVNAQIALFQSNRKAKYASSTTKKSTSSNVDKMVSNVKYLAHDATLNVSSVPPAHVVGASVAVVYNTKYKKVGIYYAEKDKKLTIRGTTIYDFDKEKSKTKTVRSPAKDVEAFRNATNANRLDVLMQNFNSVEYALTGALNEHTMILKVWK